ncbi:hypothetical protein CHU98_g12107 [Xylaria longipes]|nr:hypothetical protein CHU98_g12107 [Xylaria longipes]
MSTSQSRIAQLASTIATHTQQIDEYLAQNSLPYPSFEADGPVDLGLPPHLEQLRSAVLEATQELNDLLLGPRDLLSNHHHNQLLYLKLISCFDIAKKVPVDGEITYKDLAASVAASKLIADDQAMADWVSSCVNEMWPSAEKVVDALAKWPLAEEPNQTGFSIANNTTNSFYTELAKDHERARRFGSAMSFFTSGTGTVVDIGGSRGDAVQELPEVVAISKEEPGLNVKFMVHDFFKEQPIKNAAVYMLRWILHNWPDKYCIQILNSLVPALKQGSRVLIMDFVMPPPLVLPNLVDRKLRAMDVTMLEIGNAKERNIDEWKDLIEQADRRFILKGRVQPPGSNLTILEVEWQG